MRLIPVPIIMCSANSGIKKIRSHLPYPCHPCFHPLRGKPDISQGCTISTFKYLVESDSKNSSI
jgi:hypothetical protein